MLDRELTYAHELRSKPRNALTRSERAQLAEEDAWVAAHAADVARLDAFVGKRVTLRRERLSIGGKAVLAGTKWCVFMRTRDRLLARDHLGEVWLLREDWIRVFEESPREE